jgi:hypothetical protein
MQNPASISQCYEMKIGRMHAAKECDIRNLKQALVIGF